jgi:hypothetical protein
MLNCIYLGGAIRDTAKDKDWRGEFTRVLSEKSTILDPMQGKEWKNGKAYKFGWPCNDHTIYDEDEWMMAKCNIIILNLLAMDEGYPCIGSLIELGMNCKREGVLIFVISRSAEVINHPFVQRQATKIFDNTDDCLDYMVDLLR